MSEASVTEVARALLDYFQKNPDAQDTLDGIVQWWLPDHQHKPRMVTIKQALDSLIATGLISEHKGSDGQISYRLTRPDLPPPDKTSEQY